MHCFYHDEREAVGTCKSCCKGLCRECAVELNKGLACRGRCEADAQAVIELIDRNIKLSPNTAQLLKSSRGARTGNGLFCLAMGVVFLIWGVRDERLTLLCVMGIAFIIYSLYLLFLARKIAKSGPS
jgi:hypothetical protein